MAAYSQIVNDIWDPRTADDDAYTATDATGRGGMGGGTPIPNGPETCAADQGASKDLHCLPQQFLDRSKGRMILCKVGTACWGAGYFCQMKDTKCDSGLRMCKRKSTLTKGKKEGGMKFKFKNLRMPYVTKSSCFGGRLGQIHANEKTAAQPRLFSNNDFSLWRSYKEIYVYISLTGAC